MLHNIGQQIKTELLIQVIENSWKAKKKENDVQRKKIIKTGIDTLKCDKLVQ